MNLARRLVSIALTATVAAWLVLDLEGLPPGNFVANRMRDTLFVARHLIGWGVPPVSDRLVLVTIDVATVEAPELKDKSMAHWAPEHARVIRALAAGGAKVILLDLILPYSGQAVPGLEELGAAAIEAPLVLGVDFDETSGRPRIFNEDLVLATGDPENVLGAVHVTRDPDSIVRRAQFVQGADPGILTLWFQAARRQLDVTTAEFHQAWADRGSTLSLAGREIPLVEHDARGEYLVINYVGPSGTFPRVSYKDVLAHADDLPWLRERFQDRAVLIGVTVPDQQDYHGTPMEGVQQMYGARRIDENAQEMPGTEILAQAANTVLTGPFLTLAPPVAVWAGMILLGLAATFAGYKQRYRLAPLMILLALAYLVPLGLFCAAGILTPVAWPLGTVLLAFGGGLGLRYVTTEVRQRRLRDLFRRYVSDKVADLVVNDPNGAALGGKSAEVTVLFSDLNHFTTWSEKTPPEEVILTMNEYFTAMVAIVDRYDGTLKQFVGDEIMVIFGAPFPQPDMEERAVRTALAMREEIARLGESWAARGVPRLEAKFGIHRGRVVVGNVGSDRRTEYAAVGDTVNTGSRVMGMTKNLGHLVLITDAVYERVKDLVVVTEFPPQPVKGRDQTIQVYGLDGLK